MFKWPGVPSIHAQEHELADYVELVCWKDENTSFTALSNLLGMLDENDYSRGVPEEDDAPQSIQKAYLEIERRRDACGGGYPFVIGKRGFTLEAKQNVNTSKEIIYKYMLLTTRLNMQSNRVHAGMDGALLFEKLAAEAAREYFGKRAKSLVFGTASGTNFRGKIDDLCKRIEEGGGFKQLSSTATRARDGKLDVVVWKHFADRMAGKLIAFGQCKTGTYYMGEITRLQPDAFCGKWLQDTLLPTPLRMFFVSEALSRSDWRSSESHASFLGLLFDRCRIVDFCDNIDQGVLADINAWTEAAAKSTELPGAGNCLTHAHRHQRARS